MPGLPHSPGTQRIPAGVLLDACECRGLRVGDAMVFAKHANILVNAGHATARDVLALAEEMKSPGAGALRRRARGRGHVPRRETAARLRAAGADLRDDGGSRILAAWDARSRTASRPSVSRGLITRPLLNIILASNHLRGRMDEVFEGAGLTSAQYNVLRILNGRWPEGYPRGEIARRVMDRAPDLTRMLDRLVRTRTRPAWPLTRRRPAVDREDHAPGA